MCSGHPQPPSARHDVIVVGSGAAGSILAARLAAAGRRVLVLERGPHVDPAAFTDDEVQQYLELYNEGALQLATNFSLQVLQGMCVGGGTTINNGLCLDPPAAVLDAWSAAGIDPGGLRAAIADVRADLGIQPIRADRTSPAARRFAEAVPRMHLPGRVELMEANITDACRGTGYCNIGCGFAASVSRNVRRTSCSGPASRKIGSFGMPLTRIVVPDRMTRVSSFIAVEAIRELSVADRSRVKFFENALTSDTTRSPRIAMSIIVTISSASVRPRSPRTSRSRRRKARITGPPPHGGRR